MAAKVSPSDLPDGASWVTQMRPALVKYFQRRTGSAADAEDLSQDVLISALLHLKATSPEQAKGYIFRAAVNRLRDRRRRLQVRGVVIPYEEENIEVGSEDRPDRVLVAQEELIAIDKALEDLNVRTRTVLMLVKLENLNTATVAEMLGISVRAVNKHVQKGVAYLAKALASEERS